MQTLYCCLQSTSWFRRLSFSCVHWQTSTYWGEEKQYLHAFMLLYAPRNTSQDQHTHFLHLLVSKHPIYSAHLQ